MQRKTSIKLTLLAGATILLTLLACRFFGKPVTPTPVPPVPVDQLKFEDADTGMRFRRLDGCIRKLADSTWTRRRCTHAHTHTHAQTHAHTTATHVGRGVKGRTQAFGNDV